MSFNRLKPIFAVFLLAAGACSTDRDVESLLGPQEQGIPVVDALLLIDQVLPPVYLTETRRVDEPYSPANAAVSNAVVTVTSDGVTTNYVETRNGVYYPINPPVVLAETTYHLEVNTPDGRRVTANTTTPSRPEPARWLLLNTDLSIRRELKTFAELGDSVYFAPENQLHHSDGLLEAAVSSGHVEGFQVGVFSLDLDSDFAVDVSFLDEGDLEDIERTGSSPVIKAQEQRLRLPWFAVAFQGRYKLKVFALDANWYDYLRSSPGEGGGFGFGGNTGDNFERPLFRLDGGIGLFGAAAVDSIGFYVLPQLQSAP